MSYRGYESDSANEICYKQQRSNQNSQYVEKMLEKYCTFTEDRKAPFWELFSKLDQFVDLSDPDCSLPNSQHMYQTAEQLREDGHPEWLIFIGLVHDFGKIMFLKGNDEDGTTMETQWGIVGDTWVAGAPQPDCLPYSHYNQYNKDVDLEYKPGQGLNNVICSFGHDEYVYRLLVANNAKVPKKGLYIARFHSQYPWHTYGVYDWLENDEDKEVKEYVQLFQKYDHYTKVREPVDVEKVSEYYKELVAKFLPEEIMW